jgi:hypothetical protein
MGLREVFKMENKKTTKKAPKTRNIKNQFLLKRGTYSLVVTAVVLAAIIVFNVLVNALNNRFMLEYDITTQKVNTVSEENIEYIKNIEDEVKVTVCALAEDYYNGSMHYYAQYQHGVTENYNDYYKQTISLVEKYNSYNKNIKVEFMDTQDAAFADITSKYSKDTLNYGDIIVSCTKNGNERYKIISYKDIYKLEADETYSDYGYTAYTLTGNNIETALTSAIAYATSLETKKVAFLTGHSSQDYSEEYRNLLITNNYEVDVISEKIITKISDEYDAVFIVAPVRDFSENEITALSDFLDNGEKYDKGLVYFADAQSPYLTNFYGFLEEWGITYDEGILFETNEGNHIPNKPTALGSYPASENDMTDANTLCISAYNVPMVPAFEKDGEITVTTVLGTPNTVVGAPVGTSDSWKGASDYEPATYATLIKSERATYNSNNDLIKNSVFAFSSMDFITSSFSEDYNVSNKNVAFAAAERAAGADSSDISFVPKTITDESFATSVTQQSVNIIIIVFMALLPLACIAAGIYVFIRRKNS